MFKGVFTALITPFKDDKIDEEAFVNLVNTQIEAGINGLVPCGTTGETATLSKEEKKKLIELCVETASKRVPVIAGVGSNCTASTIEMALYAEQAGVDGLLIVTPYYNRPTQEGIFQHYKAIANAVKLPIIVYIVPKRTGVDLTDETILRLATIDNIIGLKDSTDDLARPLRINSQVKKEFYQFSADDITALAYNAGGGVGCISVASNIVPKLCAKLQKLWFDNKFSEALDLQKQLLPLYNSLFCETNPVPVKYAASLLGICNNAVRQPLVTLTEANKQLIKKTMEDLNLISPNLIDKVITDQEIILY